MQEASFDSWTIIFTVVALHGFVLSYFIFASDRGNVRANRWLGILIVVYSVTILYYVGYWTKFNQYLPRFVAVIFNSVYILGPILFLYFKAVRKIRMVRADILHFLPFCFIILLEVPIYFSMRESEFVIQYIAFYYGNDLVITRIVLQCAINLAYGIVLYRVASNWAQGARQKDLLKKFSLLFLGYAISLCTYYAMVLTGTLKVEYDYMICFAMSFFIYYVGYSGYRVPQLVGLAPGGENENGSGHDNGNGNKYEKSGLTDSAGKHLAGKLVAFMEREKPYTTNELKLQDLADSLSISSHHLSQVMNEQLDKSFNDFINSYRIDEAKRLLSDRRYQEMKIIHIAFEVGFNNKTSFNATFRKYTGMSPSEFRQGPAGGNSKAEKRTVNYS